MGTVVGKGQDNQSNGFEEMHTSINTGRCDEESSWAAGGKPPTFYSAAGFTHVFPMYVVTACSRNVLTFSGIVGRWPMLSPET